MLFSYIVAVASSHAAALIWQNIAFWDYRKLGLKQNFYVLGGSRTVAREQQAIVNSDSCAMGSSHIVDNDHLGSLQAAAYLSRSFY